MPHSSLDYGATRGTRIASTTDTTMQPQMLPGIIILNEKYFPESDVSPAKVGATSIAFSVMNLLGGEGLFAGMILYRREEGIFHPRIELQTKSSIVCGILSFNFDMARSKIRDAISAAAKMLTVKTYGSARLVILYHQTDTMLVYNPEWFPSCVTHHGPFHDDFVKHFSIEKAATAFGSPEKAQHLKKHQRIGLYRLRQSRNMFVLQHSLLQRRYLLSKNIDAHKIHKMVPPININTGSHQQLSSSHPEIKTFMRAKPSLLLFTAVARLDFFKNVELLVDAGVELLRRHLPVRVLIAGGEEIEGSRRSAILGCVPAAFKAEFKVVPKLSKDSLYALFDQVRDDGIFVCPSRYETLGITPLEAAMNGVTTIIIDSRNVEASHYFPRENRFEGSVVGLASLVEKFHKEGMQGRGVELQGKIRKQISDEKFRNSFLDAWRSFSKAARH
ncbi:hypothetical protein G7Y89_g13156 [Cudoniella acicularis]|uniref:Glycosyl transferase family 1 domain-containing protein n=1 Tax=Cudoniella acicularis TaxID=354080 RepID=A0A8H4RA35_9HELO|nr:hypothetical protein G7Y89_g13156 [Cudoniella acicularis]